MFVLTLAYFQSYNPDSVPVTKSLSEIVTNAEFLHSQLLPIMGLFCFLSNELNTENLHCYLEN